MTIDINNLTAQEKLAIAALKKVARMWPDSLWLFSGSGRLHVMQKRDGKQVMASNGAVDPNHVVCNIDIENDGGDW